MRTTITVLLTIALVASAVPFGLQLADELDSSDEAPDEGASVPGDTSAAAASPAEDPTPSAESADADDPGARAAEPASDPLAELDDPVPKASRPGASPMEMTEDMLGPAPPGLPNVDPSVPLAEAMRAHPAFPDDQLPETPEASTPMDTALSRVVQAHGILTGLMQAAETGDEMSDELVPYAAAQLATEADQAGPVFDAYSKLSELRSRSDLSIYDTSAEPIVSTESLQDEVDRLYATIGLPPVPVDLPAGYDRGKLAGLVRATTDVVQATQQARNALGVSDALAYDLDRVDQALADGQLTPEEARMVTSVLSTFHDVVTAPLQTRLDALSTLYATAENGAPFTFPASHEPTHPPDTPDPFNGTFVDPLGAIVILDEGSSRVNGTGDPVTVNVPGVGQVASLFPRSPVLVLDRGGDDIYEDLPRAGFTDPTLEPAEEPIVSREDMPIDGEETIEGLPDFSGFVGAFTDIGKQFARGAYDGAFDNVEDTTRIDVNPLVDNPTQVVIDLDGDDRYTGDVGAAWAAGGGLAAIYDKAGDDRYDVDRGIGLLEEDGLALVVDFDGDDTYTATDGMGAIIQPEEDVRMQIGGLGGLVDVNGTDTYDLEGTGMGLAIQTVRQTNFPKRTTVFPQAVPLALDLSGSPDDFQPRVVEGDQTFRFPANLRASEEGGGETAIWAEEHRLSDGDNFISISFDDPAGTAARENAIGRTFAAYRGHSADIGELSNGTIDIGDHNLTLRTPKTGCTILVFFAFTDCDSFLDDPQMFLDGRTGLHAGIHVQLTERPDRYEPPHPLILIDAGGSEDTYVDANPLEKLVNQTDGPVRVIDGNPYVNATAPVPMLVLDTGGNDRYEGHTAHLNTSKLDRQVSEDSIQLSGGEFQPLSAAALIVDAGGDDTYEGNLSSVVINNTRIPWRVLSLVYDAHGSDTIRGEQVAGTLVRNAQFDLTSTANTRQATGWATTNLLLMGTGDDETERNTVETGPGSLGSVRVFVREARAGDNQPSLDAAIRSTSAASIQGPTNYTVAEHNLATLKLCTIFNVDDESGDECPRTPAIQDISGSLLNGADNRFTGLFVGGPGADVYRTADERALGHVTANGPDICDDVVTGGASVNAPRFITRFIDVGGGDTYLPTKIDGDVPAWANDRDWVGFSCKDALDDTVSETVGNIHEDTGSQVAQSQEEIETARNTTRPVTDLHAVDARGVDNLAQYVLNFTGGAGAPAVELAEDQTARVGIRFEAPELCVGPFAAGEPDDPADGDRQVSTVHVQGFDEMRCAGPPSAQDRFARHSQEIDPTQRFILTTETIGTLPSQALDQLNICDVGRENGRNLDIRVREENVPAGNPLAHGVSGCWAHLQLRLNAFGQEPGPVWEERMASGSGWLDIAAAPLNCGVVDDSERVRCSTDAFPFPHHVDGTDGRNQARWLLPEGTHDYRLQLNGPISMLLGRNNTAEGQLEIRQDPLAEPGPVPEFPNSPTQTPAGMLAWIAEHRDELDTVAPGATDGLLIRTKSQDDADEPEGVEIWGPLELDEHQDLVPLVCVQGVPFKGDTSRADSTWRRELGVWVTTYDLREWEPGDRDAGDPPADCPGTLTNEVSIDTPGRYTVETSLWHVEAGEDPERVPLPEASTSDVFVVDETPPNVDIGPLRLRAGVDLDTHGMGINEVTKPSPEDWREGDGRFVEGDLTDRVRFELPIRITDESPIGTVTIGDTPDHPWLSDSFDPTDGVADPGTRELDLSLEWRDADNQRHGIDCMADTRCSATINLTRAGQTGELWTRSLTVNVTLEAPDGEGSALRAALEDSLEGDAVFNVEFGGGLQVSDEAANRFREGRLDVTMDLERPADLSLPCGGQANSLITSEPTANLTSVLLADDILGFVLEREIDDRWVPIKWLASDDLPEVDRHCQDDNGGEWLRFNYTPTDLAEGEQIFTKLRTVAYDEAGNRERIRVPFEVGISFDRKAPELSIDHIATAPRQVEIRATSDEPVTIQEAYVQRGDDNRIEPVDQDGDGTDFTFTFPTLAVNTTYDVTIEAVDQAGHTATLTDTVNTARSLNLTLLEIPDVVARNVTLPWLAGSLSPLEGGDPAIRVIGVARHDGQVCAERSIDAFVDAPLDDPVGFSLNLPLDECPGGELNLTLGIENGPLDDPIEHVELTSSVLHDVEAPEPDVEISGQRSETGWWTSPVTITPTGSDDTGVEAAWIETSDGRLGKMRVNDSGVHEVTVHVRDLADREAQETFRVPVDRAPPQVTLVSLDALPTEKSTITVEIRASDDASGLRSIRTLNANGTFTPWTPVIEDMQLRVDVRGLDVIEAQVKDRAGHLAKTVLPVRTLVDAPEVESASVEASGPGTIQVTAELDRAVGLEAIATEDGRTKATARSQPGTQHVLELHPLTPGASVEVRVNALLADASKAELEPLTRTITMPVDQGPPTAPSELEIDQNEDGTVRLTWTAARDDAGIQRYVVERATDGTETARWSVEDTRMLDDPPAGLSSTYKVRAVDLDGETSPWSAPATVTTTGPMRLLSYEVEPEVATAGDPVQVSVTVQASSSPSPAELELGDERIPLTLTRGGDGTWTYSANLTLPTTDTLGPKGIRFHMADQVLPGDGRLPGPIVKALADGEVGSTSDTPGLGLVAVLLAGLSAAVVRRRWSM